MTVNFRSASHCLLSPTWSVSVSPKGLSLGDCQLTEVPRTFCPQSSLFPPSRYLTVLALAMSQQMEFPPVWYRQPHGTDVPEIPKKADSPKDCRVVFRNDKDYRIVQGQFVTSFLRVTYDLSSQMPLISIIIREGEVEVELCYDCSRFTFRHMTDNEAIDRMIREMKVDVRGEERRPLALLRILPQNLDDRFPTV